MAAQPPLIDRVVLSLLRLGFAIGGRIAPRLAGRIACWLFRTPRRHTPRPAEVAVRQGGERFDVAFDGMRLAAWRWGDAERPAVLLVHGWEGRGTQLAAFVEPLLDAGFRVVTFDGPAHGESDGKQTDVPSFGPSLLAIEEAAGPFYGLIAHSFGSPASLLALEQGLQAERVIVIGASHAALPGFRRAQALLAIPEAAFEAACLAYARASGLPIEEQHIAQFSGFRAARGLVIHDVGDTEVPVEEGRSFHAHWPGSAIVETQGLGHRRILKDPAVVAQAVAFLQSA